MFGLHPNAEIGYLTSFGESLFFTVLTLFGGSLGGDGDEEGGSSAAGSTDAVVRSTIEELLERLPENFVMLDIEAKAEPLLKEMTSPYVLVAMQECTRMNTLLSSMRSSLIELQKGLDGQLNMSEPMEHLAEALSINEVPGRNPFHKTSWESLAWPSKKNLQSWFADLLQRVVQLEKWVSDLICPVSIWLPGLQNPTSFLTAIMQVTARNTGLPLDNMTIETHMTTMLKPEEAEEYPVNGMFAHGERLRWSRRLLAPASLPIAD